MRLALLACGLLAAAVVASAQEEDEFANQIVHDTPAASKPAAAVSGAADADEDEDDFDEQPASPSPSTVPAKRLMDFLVPDGLGVGVVLIYLIYYFIGKSQNSGKLDKFAKTFRATLHDQFIQTGNKTGDKETGFTTEGDASFTSWCTGRRNCLGALIELQLAARQDLMSVGLGLVQGTKMTDKVIIEVPLDPEVHGDQFVLAIVAPKEKKELLDACADVRRAKERGYEGKATQYGLDGFDIFADHKDIALDTIGRDLFAVLAANKQFLRSIHVTDLLEMTTELKTRNLQQAKRVLRVTMLLPDNPNDLRPLLSAVWQLIDKVAVASTSKDARTKVEKLRGELAAEIERRKIAAKAAEVDPEVERKQRQAEKDRRMRMTREELQAELDKEKKKEMKKMMPKAKAMMKMK